MSSRPRLSQLTLSLSAICLVASFALWWRLEPWGCDAVLPASAWCAAFSPDGRQILTATFDDGIIRVWDATTFHERAVLKGQPDIVTVAFSPDGQRIVAACGKDRTENTNAYVWNIGTRQEIAVLKGHKRLIEFAKFSPDGRWVVTASGGDDNTVRIWDAASGQACAVLPRSTGERGSWCVDFSPDSRRIVAAEFPGNTVRVWDWERGGEYGVLQGHTNSILSVAFSPDGQRIVTTAYDSTARVWDVATFRETAVLKGHTANYVSPAAFSADSRWIVTAANDETARVWDATTGQEHAVLRGHTNAVDSAVFSPDGQWIVTASHDYTVRVWNAATGAPCAVIGHDRVFSHAAFSPDSRSIITQDSGRTARIWSLRRPDCWWGIAWLPEFWIALFSGSALLVNAVRNLRRRLAKASVAPSQQPVADSQ